MARPALPKEITFSREEALSILDILLDGEMDLGLERELIAKLEAFRDGR